MAPIPRALRAARTILIPLALLALSMSAAAQPHHRAPDVRAAIERATAGLDVSASQQAELDRIAARYADSDEPGVLWRVADEVRTVLTPAQVERLQERPRLEGRRRGGEDRMARRRGDRVAPDGVRRGERRMAPRDGVRRGERMHRMDRGVAEEHRQAARALAERHHEQMEALRAEHEDGSIDAETFSERADALREQMRSDMQPLLTEEARRLHAEKADLHNRMQSVRNEVLRLTPEQGAAMEHRRRRRPADGQGDPLATLSAEQRATLSVYRALMRGGHRQDDRRVRQMER